LPHTRPSLNNQHYEVLVIGGGVNGVAIARQCAQAGRRTLLLEQHDFASGTSSRSTRIIHGGLRYLEHGEIGLVRESLRERERLMSEWPHLVRPMQFLLALPKGNALTPRNGLAVRAALALYAQLSGKHCDSFACKLRLRDFERQLDSGGNYSVFSYEDAQCEFPERLIADWLVEAIAAGTIARNHTRVLEVTLEAGYAEGARIRDSITGEEARVTADWIVNASGPWVDGVVAASGIAREQMIGGVRGSHLLLPTFEAAPQCATYAEAVDGRPIFVIPWNGQVMVGTTEVADSGDPAAAQTSPEEAAYLWNSFTRLFPRSGLTTADIRAAWAGVRPLPYSPGAKMNAISRKPLLRHHAPDGAATMISVIGGKLTTAVSLAREVARAIGIAVTEPAKTLVAIAPANGFDSTLAQWARNAGFASGLAEESARAVAEWHGRRAMCIVRRAVSHAALAEPLCPHTEHVAAEALEAVENECAVTLGDILLRRVPVALSSCWSAGCSAHAAAVIARALGWSDIERGFALDAFEQERARVLQPVNGVELPPSEAVPAQRAA
jgi:glycerol-3-phosphate dehydrogenase